MLPICYNSTYLVLFIYFIIFKSQLHARGQHSSWGDHGFFWEQVRSPSARDFQSRWEEGSRDRWECR
ncbi:hypothetical protein FR483_n338R [Paramecium bursaria Chlorella virus FR483]|uniref:Uncharacterized protein n338R n=1 Tax=Paramecium bursaria Chlorella virus FR483 TaxID=399781 RepID=A7J742_PBCVF|nr:hypothetical protein FR483_n338R [Paramecium bursaria Chlorella virus FR483]ABT15623.1 hypothetical protein FR483_n338R [Paramecium bursaria Chlorella virus FR483]